MRKIERPVYVVFPAALLDGWEVVKEPSDQSEHFDTLEEAIAYAEARGETDGGAIVRRENWYGDTDGTLEVHPRANPKRSSAVLEGRPQTGSASTKLAPSFFGRLTRLFTG
jgi:Uncharacterized protein conserved in bacteria (DUF2188)